MTQSDTYFVKSIGDGAKVTFGGAEIAGQTIKGNGSGELLVHGAGTLLVHLKAEAGFDQDGHKHPDHESIGYVVSGKFEMTVGDGPVQILEAGDTWYHPANTWHTCKALEDSVALEFHAPLRPDLLKLFDRD